MQQNSRQKCSETETREHAVRHLFTLRVCVSAWRLEDKPPRRNRLKKNYSLVKQCLRRFRGCLIIKVQKSSNKPPASRASQQCCDSRESTSILYGTEKGKQNQKRRWRHFPTRHHSRWCDISDQSQTVWCVKRSDQSIQRVC